MPSHYKEKEEAIPIPRPEDVAFSNRYSTVGAPVATPIKRPSSVLNLGSEP